MKTKWRYLLYLFALHLVMGVLAYLLLEEQLYFILPIEVLLLISFYIGYRFYRTFLAPTALVEQGQGAMKDQDFTLKFLPVGSAEVDRLISLYNNMIDNLRAERTGSQEQHFFLQKLIDTAELGVVILDYDGKIDKINDWAMKRLGITKNRGTTYEELTAIPHPLAKALAVLPMDQPAVLQFGGNLRYRCERGNFIDRGFNRSFMLIQDITRDLLAAEKDAYGKVIRMMAHEVNNSIGATNSLLQSLLEAHTEGGAEEFYQLAAEYLPVVVERGERMNQFMRNFADVIRLPPPDFKEIDLNELLNGVGKLFAGKCKEQQVELHLIKSDLPILVKGDASQLEQVVINALTNALESIEKGGRIIFSTQARPNGFTIADDGPGIDPAIADRLFTPFFSTKPTGQGVGLTLCRDILEQHAAQYILQTDADGWTRFKVSF